MVFSTPIFLFFFLPLTLSGVLLLPRRLANGFLLLASLIFYGWGAAAFLPLLAGLVGVNFAAGLALERCPQPRRQWLLTAVIAADLAVLLHAKYTNFALDNANAVLGWLGLPALANPHVLLPLGISFFTFHLLSYVIDIYRGTTRAQRNPVDFALYICFFPQLIAGPIIRYHDVEGQLRGRRMTPEKIASGAERFILGLAKKVLLANSFALPADLIFALQPQDRSPLAAWFGLLAYALQLYYDFSGYSDMAIGLGRIFGFEFLENFNYPFVSRSISEFWRRWHISLSNWFRDYLYMPMVLAAARRLASQPGGRRRKIDDRPYLALVFTLCGIWHGANWTFLIWGGVHGVFLGLERGRFGRALQGWPVLAQRAYVMAVIFLAWVFFRAPSLSDAGHFLAAMAGHAGATSQRWPLAAFLDNKTACLLPLALIGLTPAFSWLARDWRGRALQSFGQIAAVDASAAGTSLALIATRPVVMLGLLLLSCTYIAGQTYNPFIYFRF